MKWLTPVKPEKNACPASGMFQCSLIRSDVADAAAADHKATPPPPMKNARRAADAGHKTTQRQFVGAQLYAELIRKLRSAIKEKRRGKLSHGVLLQESCYRYLGAQIF